MRYSKQDLKQISLREEINPKRLEEELDSGRCVVLKNKSRKIKPVAAGRAVKCKINVNIGVSGPKSVKKELIKLKTAILYGADTVMDLSVGAETSKIRKFLIEKCPVPFGTVPVYSMVSKNGSVDLSRNRILEEIENQASEGVDFMTIHSGLRASHLSFASKRVCKIVSRGGAVIAEYMAKTGKDNPFYEYFEDILKILKKYSVTISLGDGLRPGCCADASDEAQYLELSQLGLLRKICRKNGVQAMIEGPGHVPLNLIEENVVKAREETDDAPLYFLGPLPVDIAMGRDHIAAAIGSALAGFYGVSLLCAMTPAEHIGLPELADIREGTAVFKIAAEAVNLARGFQEQKKRNIEMSAARKNFDWEKQFALALDCSLAEQRHAKLNHEKEKFCSMCGENFCAMKRSKECLKA